MIVSQIQQIETKLSEKTRLRVQLVLASLDAERDTPQKLLQFAHSRNLDLNQWTLLTSSESNVRELANVLSVKFRKEKNGVFSHSNVFIVFDARGVIQTQKTGLDSEDQPVISALQKIEEEMYSRYR